MQPSIFNLKTIILLLLLTCFFLTNVQAEQVNVTTAIYNDENLFNYFDGVLTNHDGVTYKRGTGDIDGTIIVNNERYLAFAIRGDRGIGTETFTSMDFSWTWEIKQVEDNYVFHATNGNPNFLWNQTWYFYRDFGSPMKIEHYIENNLNNDITDFQMFYLITVDESDMLEYNGNNYFVSNYINENQSLHTTGNYNDKISSVDFNSIFDFNFADLIQSNFTINEFYIGDAGFLGYPKKDIMGIGFTNNISTLQAKSNITIDPNIAVKPDTYAVYGLYDGEFHLENQYSAGFDTADIDTSVVMTSTQYAALSTDDTIYAITGGDNQDDGFLYVNFSVPNVQSINWFKIEVIAIGDGSEGWYMGAYDDVTDGWVTMNNTLAAGDVSLTYNVTGTEVATYSELISNTATFSVAMWSSTSFDSSFDGDLISVTFNYESSLGNVYNSNVSDTITIADTVGIEKTVASVFYEIFSQDTTTITDSVSITKITAPVLYEINVSDTITVTDSVSTTKTVVSVLYEVFVQDTITVTDTVNITKTLGGILYEVFVSDTISVADTISLSKTLVTILQDAITLTDNILVTKIVASVLYTTKNNDDIFIADSVGITKTPAPVTYETGVGESITISDSVNITKTVEPIFYQVNISDSITVSDSVSVTKTALNIIKENDSITLDDSISITKTTASVLYEIFPQETIIIDDALNASKTAATVLYEVYPQESISIDDSVNINKTAAPILHEINVSDSVTVTDSVSINKTAVPILHESNISDSVTVTDSVSITKTVPTYLYKTNISDSVTVTDSVTVNKIVAPLITVTLISQTPSTICQSCTGDISILYGVSHYSSDLNNTSVSFIFRGFDHDLNDSNHSIRPPGNNMAADWDLDGRILRGANRNETSNPLNFEYNVTITGGDITSWSGLDENNTEVTIVPVNSTYTLIYINGTIHQLMPQMWYIDRTEMQESPKTQLAIHKTQNVLIKFWELEIFKGNYDFLGVGYTDTSLSANPALHPTDAYPVKFYYVSSGYNPATDGDPLTSGYAVYMGCLNASEWTDHVFSPHANASYVRGFIDNNLLHSYINTTNISYIYFTSNTPSSKAFYINMTNVATSSNVSFADTKTLWAGDTTLSQLSYTPDMWFAFMKINVSFDHKIFVADNNGNWANSTINSTMITKAYFPPTSPAFYAFHNEFTDYVMNGTYHGIIQVQVSTSSDPDGGIVPHNLTLHYDNGTLIAVINDTAVAEDGVYTNVSFDTRPYSTLYSYTLRVVATDDENETATAWLGVNFTLSEEFINLTNPHPLSGVEIYEEETPTFSIKASSLVNSTWTLDGDLKEIDNNSMNPSYTIPGTLELGAHTLIIDSILISNTSKTEEFIWYFTVIEPSALGTGGSGGAGPSISPGVSNEPSENVLCFESGLFRNIKCDYRTSYTIRNDECLRVTNISFLPTMNSREQPIYIERLINRSVFVTEDVPDYRIIYFSVFIGFLGYDSKTEQEKIYFKLRKNDLEETGLDEVSVKLYKWSTEKKTWIRKYTEYVDLDENFYYYEADSGATTGIFAISGKELDIKEISLFREILNLLPGLGHMDLLIPESLDKPIIKPFLRSIEKLINDSIVEYVPQLAPKEDTKLIVFTITPASEKDIENSKFKNMFDFFDSIKTSTNDSKNSLEMSKNNLSESINITANSIATSINSSKNNLFESAESSKNASVFSIESLINGLISEFMPSLAPEEDIEIMGFIITAEQENESESSGINVILIAILSLFAVGALSFYYNSDKWSISLLISIILIGIIYIILGNNMIDIIDSNIINLIINVILIVSVSYLIPGIPEKIKEGEL